MYLLYSLLLTLGMIVLLPRFAIDAFRAGKYVTGLRQRFGRLPILPDSGRPLIWLHCVSVGETEAARPLVKALLERFPNYRLAVSTTTVTGQHVANRVFNEEVSAIFYFPIDWAWTVRRVLRTLRPSAVLIVETELWPNLLRECRRQSIPVALVNGRVSQTSFRRYLWIRNFMRRVLNNLSAAIMQSERDAQRIRELGIPPALVVTRGNLKFDGAVGSRADALTARSLRERFGFNPNHRVVVAASTHELEESIVIDAFMRLRDQPSPQRIRLLIAPRHPERFDAVAEQIDKSGLKLARRSSTSSSLDRDSDVILLDSIGEVRAAYALADVAFVGGSIVPRGGHNVLEPAAQGVCVVTGPHMDNFAVISQALLEQDAIVQLPNVTIEEAPQVLASTLANLLSDPDRRQQLGARAVAVCEQNRGATQHTIEVIARLLEESSSATQPIHFTPYEAAATK
jgi:3-deoxy-D-manno-octulosonic-acid transferase